VNGPTPRRPVLAIGLDGADWDLMNPLLEAGALPAIADLLEGGAHAILESTVPPVTFPAWTTFLTGVNPGRHGVLDFTRWTPGDYGVRLTGGGAARRVPTLLEHLAAAGRRVASVGVPGTYPPLDLPGGFVLAGFDAPVAIGPGPDFACPKALYQAVVDRHGPWVYADVDELTVGTGWHEAARERLLDGLARKGRIARALLEAEPWDLFLVHLGETDTAGHHFFAHHDPGSPRRPEAVSPAVAATLADVYREADRVIGALVAAAGEGARVLLASDHGMVGASDRTFHPNRALNAAGLLAFDADGPGLVGGGPEAARQWAGAAGRRLRDAAVAGARDLALAHLPARVKEALVRRLGGAASSVESRRRLAGIDLFRTLAFSEELTYAPSVRLNVRDREPLGLVPPEDADAVLRLLESLFLGLRDPEDGAAVIAAARRREAVLDGPAVAEAPDLYLEVAAPGGYRVTVLPSGGRPGPAVGRLVGEAKLGGKGRGPTGVHRAEGVLVLAGAEGVSGDLGRVPIGACAPTLMALCGVAPQESMDWPSLVASPGGPAETAAVTAPAAAARTEPSDAADYSPEEEARVAERLRALGYID
jgi:predicted AlkP superfamily phosphohydrolase/phosphomutase